MLKVYPVVQKDRDNASVDVQVAINLVHVVSMGSIDDRDKPGEKLIHVRMINGDYLNVRAPFDELLSAVNEV